MASKQSRKQCYKREYTEKWPCILPSKKGNSIVRCELCDSDFGIAHGGATDITLHIGRIKHKNAAAARKGTPRIASFVQQQKDFSVIRAETLMTNFFINNSSS